MNKNQEQKKIDRYVGRKISRKFEKSLLPSIASELRKELIAELHKNEPPTGIFEIFDRLQDKFGKGYRRPYHLVKYIEALELAKTNSVKCVLHSPAQHGKTTSTMVGLIYLSLVGDGFKSMYVTYSQSRTKYIMNEFCWLLDILGIEYTKKEETVFIKSSFSKNKNSVMFTSIDGGITGYPANLICIDDYVKNADDIRTAAAKDKLEDNFKRVVLTRKGVDTLSVIVIATRQANDDLSGRLIDNLGYEYIRLPAICDSDNDPNGRQIGEVLWPEGRTLEDLLEAKRKSGEKIWELLYQGNTVSDGLRIFEPATTYFNKHDKNEPLVTVYGVDLAYDPSDTADWSVAVRIVVNKNTGIMLVDDVIMVQKLYREFFKDLRSFVNYQPGPIFWYAGSLEAKTSGEELKKSFPRTTVLLATKSKYHRAGDTAKEWNAGYLKVPSRQSETMRKFISTVELFTGEKGGKDDGVDALVAAVDQVKHFRQNAGKPHVLRPTPSMLEQQKQRKNSVGSINHNSNRRDVVL